MRTWYLHLINYRNPSHSISWDFRFLNQGMLIEKNHDILANLSLIFQIHSV